MNGQDFNDIESDAYVTFVGTGSNWMHYKILLLILLIALLILACCAYCSTGRKLAPDAPNVFGD